MRCGYVRWLLHDLSELESPSSSVWLVTWGGGLYRLSLLAEWCSHVGALTQVAECILALWAAVIWISECLRGRRRCPWRCVSLDPSVLVST